MNFFDVDLCCAAAAPATADHDQHEHDDEDSQIRLLPRLACRWFDSFNQFENQRHNRSYLILSFTLMRTQLFSKTLVTRDDSNLNMINLIVRCFDFICSLNIDVFFYVLFKARRLFTYFIELFTILLLSLRVSKKKVRRNFSVLLNEKTTKRFLLSAHRLSNGQILFVSITTDLCPSTSYVENERRRISVQILSLLKIFFQRKFSFWIWTKR